VKPEHSTEHCFHWPAIRRNRTIKDHTSGSSIGEREVSIGRRSAIGSKDMDDGRVDRLDGSLQIKTSVVCIIMRSNGAVFVNKLVEAIVCTQAKAW
jgi:hypothetical protein